MPKIAQDRRPVSEKPPGHEGNGACEEDIAATEGHYLIMFVRARGFRRALRGLIVIWPTSRTVMWRSVETLL